MAWVEIYGNCKSEGMRNNENHSNVKKYEFNFLKMNYSHFTKTDDKLVGVI